MTELAGATSVNPLANTEFRRLFTAQVIALVGTGLSTVALTLLAYDLVGGNAAAVLGTALAFKMIAYVVFAPIVGGLAHRFSRKPFLIGMDVVRAGIVLAMPFVTQVWQIYLLIFLLNLFSAGFKPVFAATIPDILPEERTYTRALSMSRLAYDLENLLSPTIAGIALLFTTYTGLFLTNSAAFLVSAALILVTVLPPEPQGRAPGQHLERDQLWHPGLLQNAAPARTVRAISRGGERECDGDREHRDLRQGVPGAGLQ